MKCWQVTVTICQLTYHPCFDTQFRHDQTTQQYFRTVAMSSREKWKRSSCPFVPKRAVKRKKRKLLFPLFRFFRHILMLFWPIHKRNYQSEEWKLQKLGWNTPNSTVATCLRHERPTVMPGRTEMYRQISVQNSIIWHLVWSVFEGYCYEVSWAVCL